MKLQVHSIHFDADDKLIDFIQKKIDKLETFYDRLVDGQVFLRLNNEGVENKTVEIKLKVPGNQLFAKEQARSFEEAIPLVLLVAVLGLPAILIFITTRKVVYVFWMLIYLLALPVWNFILPVYAFWHFDDFSWGETRYVPWLKSGAAPYERFVLIGK